MGKLVKIIGIIIGLGLLLIAALAFILPQIVDPAEYKPRIIAEVKAATGRDLRLDGDIRLSVFPWLGLELGAAQLSNAKGFDHAPFARVEAVDIRVKLLPLLRKEVEMSTLRLVGMELNLARDANGRGNWSGLVRAGNGDDNKTTIDSASAADDMKVASLAIGGIEINNAKVSWKDAQAGSDLILDELDLSTGPLAGGKPVNLSLSFAIKSQSSQLNDRVSLRAKLTADIERQRYTADDLKVVWSRVGQAHLHAELSSQLEFVQQAQTLNLDQVRLQIAGLSAEGELRGQRIMDAAQFTGQWRIAEFSPRSLLEVMSTPLPETADPAVLGQAGASFSLAADKQSVRLSDVRLQLDDSHLEGELTLSDFANLHIGFKASIDALDLDRYLPPVEQNPATASATPATPAAATALPLETLRALHLTGDLKIGSLKAYGMHSSNISLTVKAKDGDVRVAPASAELYQGRYQGDIGINAGGKEARLSVNERFTDIQVGDMLNDLQGQQRLSGRGDMQFRLTSRGADMEAMRQHLSGTAAIDFRDGAVKGIDVGRLVREAQAALKGQSLSGAAGDNSTDFSELSATATINEGVARSDDLLGKSPFLRVTGAGTADIARAEMDYLLKVVIVGSGKGQGGAELAELKGIPVPLRISGPFANLAYRVDLQAAVQDAARAKVEEKVEEQKQKVEEKIRDRVGDKLKGLFGR